MTQTITPATAPATAQPIDDPILVREWNVDAFHRKVLDLEEAGYVARRETYKIIADVHPETGEVIHLHSIELVPAASCS